MKATNTNVLSEGTIPKKSLKSKVEFILSKYPQTRNSDTQLAVKLWHVFYAGSVVYVKDLGWVLLIEKMLEIPREDHISRVRRKFQEMDMYLPTSKKVAEKRKLNMKIWREKMQNKLFFN